MKIYKFKDRDTWLAFRIGKISGTRLKDIIVKRGTEKKKGYYELIAERLSVIGESELPNETPMDRGTRLQSTAIERFEKATKKKVDSELVMWVRSDNENIAISPDGAIGKAEAIEIKCLSSASHLEAFLTQTVPSEYRDQGLQYFIVNEKLETLHFVFYDPRIPAKDYFTIKIERKDIQEDIDKYLEYEKVVLKEIDDIVLKLTKF